MQQNAALAFLIELFTRLKSKSPKFFVALQWVFGAATIITGVPELLTYFQINLPDYLDAIASKTVAIAASVAWFISKLPVLGVHSANAETSPKNLPFTEKKQAEGKEPKATVDDITKEPDPAKLPKTDSGVN